ncbi:DUF2142 domain-containing protein [Microbacterium aureliae]
MMRERAKGLFREVSEAQLWGAVAATAMLAAALLSWAVVTPGMRGPDEPNHIATAVELFETGEYPPPGTSPFPVSVRASYPWFGFPGAQEVFPSAGPVGTLPAEPPSLSELRIAGEATADASVTNQITQHPPLYYILLAGSIHALSLEETAVTGAVMIMRLLSGALLLPIPALVGATCRRLGLPPTAQLVAMFVPAAWIQFSHINALVGNGSLLILASTVSLALMVRVATGDMRVRTALMLGGALACALWTKGYALALLLPALLAYAWRWRADRGRIWLPMLSGALVTCLGLIWYVRALISQGTLQPTAHPDRVIPFAWEPLVPWLGRFAHDLSGSMWMNLGWLETPVQPAALHIAASLGAIAIGAIGVWRLRRRPVVVIILLAAIALTLAIFAVGSARHWLWNGTIRAAQGRYLHGTVLAFAVLIAAGLPRRRWVAIGAPALAALAVVAGVVFGVRHFWQDASILRAAEAWPAGGAALAVAAALLLGSLAAGTVAALRSAEEETVGPLSAPPDDARGALGD